MSIEDILYSDKKNYNYINDNYTNKDLSNNENLKINIDIDLPSHYKKKTLSSLLDYLKSLNGKSQRQLIEEKTSFNQKIKELFFYFLACILMDYQNFLFL